MFVSHSTDSCRYSMKAKAGVRTFNSTIKQIWSTDQSLFGTYGYSTLCKKLRRGRLGLARACNRSDKCSVCAVWDWTLAKRLKQFLNDAYADVGEYAPRFFDEWNKICEQKTGCRKAPM